MNRGRRICSLDKERFGDFASLGVFKSCVFNAHAQCFLRGSAFVSIIKLSISERMRSVFVETDVCRDDGICVFIAVPRCLFAS